MRGRGRKALLATAIALLVGALSGHVRLRNPATGAQLAWSTPSVPVVIQIDGSDDVLDGSVTTAIRLAIQDWNAVDGSALILVEDTDPTQRARRDWEASKLHTILFDEDGGTGFFGGSGIVAVTSVRYLKSGKLSDADVIFNGLDYSFSTSGESGAFDVQAIAAHELGHVAGFDHSGWANSVLYPFVEANDHVARALSLDERGALRSVYPSTTYGTISGSVARSLDGSSVAGAHITARDEEGRTAGSVLSGPNGLFVLRGLDGGSYWLNVLPFEGVASDLNLTGGQVIDTDFSALVDIGPLVHTPGGSTATGPLFVEAEGQIIFGSPTDSLPLRLLPGTTAGATIRGTGLVAGSSLEASDPDLMLQNVTWNGGSVVFRVAVPAGEAFGSVDLIVRAPDGESSVLTGALEITPANPSVSSIEPVGASSAGGTDLVLSGSGFRAGCRVVIGNRIYREGLAGGCMLLGDGSLSLRLLATLEGTHDVVVIDRSGVEGRLNMGLVVDQRPVVATLFPSAGQSQGGTLVRITGSGFGADTRVLMGAVEQPGLVIFDATRLEFVTLSGTVGTQDLQVLNAAGLGAQSSFDLTSTSDPVLLIVDPPQGERSGGEVVELAGANLNPACRVLFGVDPNTGLGGSEAQVVEGGDGSLLTVLSPGFAQSGLVAVAIQDLSTGQAFVLGSAFLVLAQEGSGGGACASIAAAPEGLRGILESSAWMLLLVLLVAGDALRRGLRPQPPGFCGNLK